MDKGATINVRTNTDTKKQAKHIAESMGVTLSTAINMFLVEFNKQGKFPFTPTGDLESGIEDEKHGRVSKSFDNAHDMLEDMLK